MTRTAHSSCGRGVGRGKSNFTKSAIVMSPAKQLTLPHTHTKKQTTASQAASSIRAAIKAKRSHTSNIYIALSPLPHYSVSCLSLIVPVRYDLGID